MSLIHPTAIVEDGARLGADVSVGAFSIVGSEVTLEDGVSLDAHVIVRGKTTIGARTRIAAFAVIGGEAQDLSYKGEATTVVIGPDCVIREHVTIHRGTARGRGTTSIGSRCFLMIGSHIAHDCVVGNDVILTNQAVLGGHAQVGDFVILGGLAAVQQRARIGAHAFVGGLTGVTQDVVPYVMVTGRWGALSGLNVIGLRRRGFSRDEIRAIREAYKLFFAPNSGTRAERLDRLVAKFGTEPALAPFIEFVRETGNKPLAHPRSAGDAGQRKGNSAGPGEERDDDGG